MVYNLCHFPGLGQVGHSPRGTSGSAGILDWGPMWLGPQCCHQWCDQPEVWQVDTFAHGTWPIAAGWLADWVLNKVSTWPPRQRNLVAKCVTAVVRSPSGQTYPQGLLHKRLTFGQMDPQAETSCGQVWYYCIFGLGWPVVKCTPSRDILWPSVLLLWSGRPLVTCTPQGLLHKRPFTRKGNYPS